MRFRMAIKLASKFVVLAAALACGLSGARAQDYPQRTIRLVVGYGAGGGTDLVARIVAQALQEKLGQTVIVENKVGASGMLGADSVAKATPDGYTLYLVNNAHVIVGVMHKSVPYNTLSSFQTVGQVATGNLLIVAHPSFPAKNVGELIALAKKDPGKFTYASVGQGTTQHFTGELFSQIAGVQMLHVPFRNSPAATAAVLGKQVDLQFDTVSAVLGQVQSGDLRALALSGRERFAVLPNVPTGIESGQLPDFEVTTWYGVVAPAGTPAPIVNKLNAALNDIVKDKAVQERIEKAGAVAQGSTVEGFRQHMAAEMARWDKVRETAKIDKQ